MCDTIVSSMLSNPRPAQSLTTRAQVDWTLEVVGHSFQLPLNDPGDARVIDNSLRLYRSWLGLAGGGVGGGGGAEAGGKAAVL